MICAQLIAKGHSSRLPRKNVKQFCGKSLLAWTLIQAKYSQVDETFVSTDDEEIARICEQYGATVHWREHEAESDVDIAGGVPGYFLRKWIYENRANVKMMIHMFCTAPLRRPGDIDAAIDMCRQNNLTTFIISKRYDTFIERIIAPNRYQAFIADKSYAFGDTLAGFSVHPAEADKNLLHQTADAYRGEWWKRSERETHMDPDMFNILNIYARPAPAINAFVECEPWQIVEIDYAWQFDLAEYLMKKYILKDGEDVYERYYEEHYAKRKR